MSTRSVGMVFNMNNEPVAWKHKPSGVIFDEIIEAAEPNDLIPLYTHPAKTLTEDTECQYCKQGCIRCDARKTLTDDEIEDLANKYLYVLNDIPYAKDIKDFARAILRKAQEK